jgi:hypothetical protein
MQSMMFLNQYGKAQDIVRFWMQRQLYDDVATYLQSHEIPDEFFVHDVLMVAISTGALERLLGAFAAKDANLRHSRQLFDAGCRFLNSRKAYKLMVRLQVFLSDWSRAGASCIKLSMRAPDVGSKISYLEKAATYFGAEMDARLRGVSGSRAGGEFDDGSAAKVYLSDQELRFRLATAQLSADVLRELQSANAPAAAFSKSLFGPPAMKIELAQHLVLAALHDVAFRVIQGQRLPAAEVYGGAIQTMVVHKNYKQIGATLKHVQGLVDDSDWEQIVLSVVRGLADTANDLKTAESYLSQLTSTRAKMEGFLLCRKFKSSYLLAVQLQDFDFVRRIMERSLQHGDRVTAALCSKFADFA